MQVVRAVVGIDKIQFFLQYHNRNKLIRKFEADRVMRVRFVTKGIGELVQGRAKTQAHIVLHRGIELAGRHYQYCPLTAFLILNLSNDIMFISIVQIRVSI